LPAANARYKTWADAFGKAQFSFVAEYQRSKSVVDEDFPATIGLLAKDGGGDKLPGCRFLLQILLG